jgi:hypothetical protein
MGSNGSGTVSTTEQAAGAIDQRIERETGKHR